MKKRNLYFWFLLSIVALGPWAFATWDVTTPAGSEAKSLGDDRIREFKSDVQTSLQYEGDFPGPDTSNPRFIYTPSTGTSAGRPSGSTNTATGMLYINKTNNTIEQYNGSTWDVIASSLPPAGSIGVTQISSAIAGVGLTGGGGIPLAVNADTNTFTFGVGGDTITIKANSIGNTQLASSVTISNVGADTAFLYKSYAILPVLQIQQGTQNTTANYNSATFVDTGITVSITPKLASSKILVRAYFTTTQGAGDTGFFTLARNSTNLGGSAGFQRIPASNEDAMAMEFYDSPATTSGIVYKVQYRNTAAAGSNNVPAATNTTAVITATEYGQ